VGIDLRGTSREGLEGLLHSTTNGEVWIFHNNLPTATFHPKLYLFRNSARAKLIVGSGNLTESALFTNYETAIAALLDLAVPADVQALASVEQALNSWSHEQTGLCYRLTGELLNDLVATGLVLSEAAMNTGFAAAGTHGTGGSVGSGTGTTAPLFTSTAIPPAPTPPSPHAAVEMAFPPQALAVPEEPAETAAEPMVGDPFAPTGLPTVSLGGATHFVMTLQNTDVGVGQITPGTSRRSPEVFIPLAALDANQAFWKFPDEFVEDEEWNEVQAERRNGLGKLDREGVPFVIGTPHEINMFFNPQKRDLRLRHEALRSAGHVGDLMLLTALDPDCGHEYHVQVAAQGSALYEALEPYCNVTVGHGSHKMFGYF
jgi:hypothetical protein